MSDIPGVPDALDRTAPVSLHAQISNRMRSRIVTGEWPSHYRLKTEPELAAELGVSRGTLRRALTTLIHEGLLRQVRGRGTFVTAPQLEPAIAQRLRTLSEDFEQQGIEADTEVIACELIEPPRPIASFLDVTPGQKVLQLVRVRTTADGPLALLNNFVRAELVPGIEKTDFTVARLFRVLEVDYHLKVGSARRTFTAQPADANVARRLQLDEGAPILYMQQITYLTNNSPIEYSDIWIHSGRLQITSFLSRK
ncbi:MAG: GntR family transcriptional regulator [Micrococcales bacterium]|nr:GntR family transcriptional regulator [Micrococcales bacterium]